MAQNNMNSRDDGLRSRMRKYDTYTPRPGNARSNPVNQARPSVISSPVAPQPKSALPAAAAETLTPPVQQVNTSPHLAHPAPATKTPHSSSKMLALRAVNNARLSENDMFPDQMNTVYGNAKRKLSRLQKLMYGFGVLVLVFSMAVSVQSFINNKNAKDQIGTLGATSSKDDQGISEGTGDEPSEEEISQAAISAYRVSNPEDPKYLRIPDLKVFARIKNLGVESSGAVDAPHNVYDAGWYNGSVRPGSKAGSSLILGHVSGWTAPGVFKHIKDMKPGMQFEIEKGTGEKISYEVTKTETIPVDQVDMSKILSTEVAGEHDIKLMTCGGKYDKDTKSFTDRVVVYGRAVK